MKLSSQITIAFLLFVSLSFHTGCKDQNNTLENAKAEIKEAKDMRTDDLKALEASEWETFKAESEEKIMKNEVRIAELREKIKKSGENSDAHYKSKIDKLEKKNNQLKEKIRGYDKSQNNWDSFKSEFNHDMNELGDAFKGLTVDDK